MSSTTIRVPSHLRDRINAAATKRGLAAAKLLDELVGEYERNERLEAVRRAYAELPPDDDYWSETAEWDTTLGDRLGGE